MKIFVYGTLKSGFSANSLMLRAGGKLIGEAVTTADYQLYDQGSFPGLVEEQGEKGVHGEVYEVPESGFKDLDRYECTSTGLFRRSTIHLKDGTTAMAYLFGRGSDGGDHVESGMWTNDR